MLGGETKGKRKRELSPVSLEEKACSLFKAHLGLINLHGIFQARILEWVVIPFSRDLPHPGIEPSSSALQADSLLSKPPGKAFWSLPSPSRSDGKASAYNAGDPGSIPGWGRSLEKEMATHSSTLVWKIPWTEEPDRLQSMGS